MSEQTTCHLGLAHCHRAEAAEAEVERLTDALAERDQRIALAVAFCDEFSGVQVAVTTARILRGES